MALSAAALAPRAAGDAGWAAIWQALRQERHRAKAARKRIAQVVGACTAAKVLQAAWREKMARAQAWLERRAQLVRRVRLVAMLLRGGGGGGDRVLPPRFVAAQLCAAMEAKVLARKASQATQHAQKAREEETARARKAAAEAQRLASSQGGLKANACRPVRSLTSLYLHGGGFGSSSGTAAMGAPPPPSAFPAPSPAHTRLHAAARPHRRSRAPRSSPGRASRRRRGRR